MFKIEEAIALAMVKGKRIMKKDLAAKLWPGVSETGQAVNMSNLCSGKTQTFRPEWVQIICEETGCTADFLFGIKN